ncbi:GNAT family N-acetyltransferase [Chitinimonas arctica]|uniref:GNAT family N-acetyltransferase n=1 Tax=Chitinimonas arctica TaxID=2594795 RepID=A0A516SGF1_9NEIS|nr:GNAT family N-acetyltransferase [Chitinimonas arctica]QDQ27241.1 GNAT family N-acetyltransferase [Chitinimonas arctica]
MQIEICPTSLADKRTIWNLFQFYCYDTSIEDGYDVEADGFFSLSADYFAQYWDKPRWSAHLVRANGAIAGFVLIEPSDVLPHAQEIGDLFILKRWRRQGIAEHVAKQFLARRTETWAITVFNEWRDARSFWTKMFSHPALSVDQQLADPDGRDTTVFVLEPNMAA